MQAKLAGSHRRSHISESVHHGRIWFGPILSHRSSLRVWPPQSPLALLQAPVVQSPTGTKGKGFSAADRAALQCGWHRLGPCTSSQPTPINCLFADPSPKVPTPPSQTFILPSATPPPKSRLWSAKRYLISSKTLVRGPLRSATW